MHFQRLSLVATALILAGVAPAVATGSTTGTLNVSATVTAGCTITSVGSLTFPAKNGSDYVAGAVSSTNSATLTYVCDPGTSPSLSFNTGSNSSTSTQMKGSNGGYLPYTLTSGTFSQANGQSQQVSISGVVLQQTTAPAAGVYTDAVTVTLSF